MSILRLSGLSLLAVALTLPMQATAQVTKDPKILKDLGSVLALQGKSCGQVTQADKKGENDYVASCSSGDRYRITINNNDRVVITKL